MPRIGNEQKKWSEVSVNLAILIAETLDVPSLIFHLEDLSPHDSRLPFLRYIRDEYTDWGVAWSEFDGEDHDNQT